MRAGQFAIAALAALLGTASVGTGPALAQEGDSLAFSAGWFDVLHRDDDAAEFRLEYRSGASFLYAHPFAGGMVTTDGALHGFIGVLWDIPLGPIIITPSFAPGLFHEGDGKDIGSVIEFRSQIEIGLPLDNGGRIAVSFNHISNAGITDRNPGVESVALTYVAPLGSLFGN
ncbi:acyloxyacyl hydrolase [Zavarzinia sp. CC-PAN008]|uniref:acyloxyacyl hydrolase n=1 Tax=Zavarzinia sp. CC-PAN008 TaxID=3243332 RepID=UPI003F742636